MKDFVYGSDRNYDELKEMLEDHLCHVYVNTVLPAGCNRVSCRIGFEKEGDTYALFIDKGITCTNDKATRLFQNWLSEGTLRFLDYTDLKEFLRSLCCLY